MRFNFAVWSMQRKLIFSTEMFLKKTNVNYNLFKRTLNFTKRRLILLNKVWEYKERVIFIRIFGIVILRA